MIQIFRMKWGKIWFQITSGEKYHPAYMFSDGIFNLFMQ